MNDAPDERAARTRAECENRRLPSDGARTWLGLVIVAACVACTAAAIGFAAVTWWG